MCGTVMADDNLPSKGAVLNAVSTTLTVQAQEMLHSAKAEIMASLQRELGNSIAAVTDEMVQETFDTITETSASNIAVADVATKR
ncbi:MAG: hypothetical protein LRY40_06360 [Shewanella fodinae]|nr:hypothetical protein [Shewanella fodinae]